MIKETLTGFTRYRVHKLVLGKQLVVLQVQYHLEGYVYDGYGGTDDVDKIGWRDAKPEDITIQKGAQ